MKIVVFAGGVGTRLWPLSRENSPKQFECLIGDKSTLQLTIERLLPAFDVSDIYISTNIQYVEKVRSQLMQIPKKNIIGEPEMRDVGPAVGMMSAILSRNGKDEPFAILWSDHLVKNEEKFRRLLLLCEKIVKKEPQKIIFIAQKPRFASQNLGWIEFNKEIFRSDGIKFYKFSAFKYRPDIQTAKQFFKRGHHAWNLGYFVTTPHFLLEKYKTLVPEMYKKLLILQKAWQSHRWQERLIQTYPLLEKISFDNAILEKLSKDEAYVVSEELNWSDIGAWEALKEALQKNPDENITHGNVFIKDSKDNLVYNYNNQQILTAIDLEGMLVVNTQDAILVCRTNSVPKIKKMVEGFKGTENEHLR